MENSCCKVCGQSFPSPRLFAVHMRSHVLLKTEEEPMCRYGFRENPKKSWRLKQKEKDMLCTKCGEGFISWSSFFKHMKCHSEMRGDNLSIEDNENDEKDLKRNVFPTWGRRKKRKSSGSLMEYDYEAKMCAFRLMMLSRGVGSATISSDSCFSKFDFGINEPKKDHFFPIHDSESEFSHKRKKFGDDLRVEDNEKDEKNEDIEENDKDLNSNRSYEMQNLSGSKGQKKRKSSDSLVEYDEEAKIGAFCLMMLSSGAGSTTTSSDSCFPKFDFEMNEPKKDQSFPKHDFAKNELIKIPSFPSDTEFSHKAKKSKASPDNKCPNSVVSDLGNRGSYKCRICNKSFRSGQALGGHMASHKKINANCFSEIPKS